MNFECPSLSLDSDDEETIVGTNPSHVYSKDEDSSRSGRSSQSKKITRHAKEKEGFFIKGTALFGEDFLQELMNFSGVSTITFFYSLVLKTKS